MVKLGKLSLMEMLSVLPSHVETTRQIQAEEPSVKLLVWTLQKGWRAVPDQDRSANNQTPHTWMEPWAGSANNMTRDTWGTNGEVSMRTVNHRIYSMLLFPRYDTNPEER